MPRRRCQSVAAFFGNPSFVTRTSCVSGAEKACENVAVWVLDDHSPRLRRTSLFLQQESPTFGTSTNSEVSQLPAPNVQKSAFPCEGRQREADPALGARCLLRLPATLRSAQSLPIVRPALRTGNRQSVYHGRQQRLPSYIRYCFACAPSAAIYKTHCRRHEVRRTELLLAAQQARSDGAWGRARLWACGMCGSALSSAGQTLVHHLANMVLEGSRFCCVQIRAEQGTQQPVAYDAGHRHQLWILPSTVPTSDVPSQVQLTIRLQP